MRLKRLELFGFKSFADRTALDFQSSLTGIVGPNGCGKSNVVDAIRWCLGEQRPTSMRGGEMTDVIFKGSASRPPLSVAEVTLVLDNACGTVEGRGAELSITRRVFKSGEGEYLLDGERVRLKDVRDTLFDTGLGSRGYSVLEQGKIDAILSANPLERRAIFEEAAGISRYRQRRQEAESKLKRVERDLERLEDVTRELSTRARSLKIQAGKAERFLAAREGWRESATRYARHRADELARELADLRERIAAAEARAEELRERRREGEARVQELERERAALAGEAERGAERAAEAAAGLSALDERRVQLSARVAAWRRSSDEERARAQELGARLAERRGELDLVREAVLSLRAEAEAAGQRLAELTRGLADSRRALRELEEDCEARNERVLGLLHEKTAADNDVRSLERSLAPLSERLERSAERLAEAQRAREAAQTAVVRADVELRSAEERVTTLERRRFHLDSEVRALETRTAELREKKAKGELERTRIESRIESLLDREAERERLDAGSRELIELLEADGEGAFAGGARPEIAGLLADHVRTSTRFARALDAVLGERAQAVVVRGADDAGRVLGWLKQEQRGLARLVLPRGVGRCCPVDLSEVVRRPGVEGALLDFADVDAGYEELAEALLCATAVVEDVDTAMDLVARFPGLRCVTPDGDLVDSAGVTGGHREVVHGAVGRRASAAELGTEAAALARRTGAVSEELARIERRRGELAGDAREALELLDEARQALGDARGVLESARTRARDLSQAVETCAHEEGELADELQRTRAALEVARERLTVLAGDFARENGGLEARVRERRAAEAAREGLARDEAQARVESTRLAAELEAGERRTEVAERGLQELGREEERARELSLRHARDASDGERQHAEIEEARAGLLQERGRAAELVESLRERERAARAALDGLRVGLEGVTGELEAEMDGLAELHLGEQRSALSREELVRRAAEELSLDEAELARDFAPEEELGRPGALDDLARVVHDLKRELERLGSVNLEAVDELEEVSGRLTFLEEQKGDVQRARTALLDTVRTINEESERLFLEAFHEIRENFERLFRQLFGGGRATIELAPDQPVLEAGIEISARPPGREMLPLGLLSGGQRTMTALGLLFAVFQSRPSPFCVLDEVDAALDDANIGRFLVLLDGFRQGTQFVVVTHNKGTMSACSSLYGITMETRGVSRQVSVQLSDVDDFVPEVAGDAGRAQEARRELVQAAEDGRELDGDTGEPVVELVPGGARREPAEPAESEPVEAEPAARAD